MVVSGDAVLNSLLYGVPSSSTINYFKEKVDYLQNNVVSGCEWLRDKAIGVFNNFYSYGAIREAQEIIRNSAAQFREDTLHLVSFDNYTPNLMTQSYIMECPEVFERYKKDMTDNFGGTYYDPEPYETVSRYRTQYANVMDGVLQFDSDGNGYTDHYYREDEEEPLTLEDKVVVLRNWDVVKSFLDSGMDPTCKD